jgi:opacity protein-like surface antigen
MSAHRLAWSLCWILLLSLPCFSQLERNARSEISGTIGRTFVSTQTIQNANFFNHDVHFGDGLAFALNYGFRWRDFHGLGLTAELPIAVALDTDLNTGQNLVPASYKAFFVTPSLRVHFFPNSAVTPWVSGGGGYVHFKQAGHLLYFGPNPGPTSTNTGAVQFGAGLDVWPWQRLGFRLEARDFYSGHPDLNVDTGRSMQHNYYVGTGVLLRF